MNFMFKNFNATNNRDQEIKDLNRVVLESIVQVNGGISRNWYLLINTS